MLKVNQSGASNPAKECFSPSKVKKWAIDDLNKTVSWLESQEEKVFMFWFCYYCVFSFIIPSDYR